MEKRFDNKRYSGCSEPCYNKQIAKGIYKVGCLVIGYANPVAYLYPAHYGYHEYFRKEICVPIFV